MTSTLQVKDLVLVTSIIKKSTQQSTSFKTLHSAQAVFSHASRKIHFRGFEAACKIYLIFF